MNLFLCLLLHKYIKRSITKSKFIRLQFIISIEQQTIIDITDYDYQQQTS
jgi:hypothetical protein